MWKAFWRNNLNMTRNWHWCDQRLLKPATGDSGDAQLCGRRGKENRGRKLSPLERKSKFDSVAVADLCETRSRMFAITKETSDILRNCRKLFWEMSENWAWWTTRPNVNPQPPPGGALIHMISMGLPCCPFRHCIVFFDMSVGGSNRGGQVNLRGGLFERTKSQTVTSQDAHPAIPWIEKPKEENIDMYIRMRYRKQTRID
jgi:hypothetical protein